MTASTHSEAEAPPRATAAASAARVVGRRIRDHAPEIASAALFFGLWGLGHSVYGGFILPSPLQTLGAIAKILAEAQNWLAIGATALRALGSALIALCLGGGLGVAAGYSAFLRRMLRPWAAGLLGMPAIAWLVLTMIWFGPNSAAVAFTVVATALPVAFLAALEATLARDRRLELMAASVGAGPWARFRSVALPQIAGQAAAALTILAGLSFKVAIMAELLTYAPGVGGALARARSNLAIDEALAWVAVGVAALLILDRAALRPLTRRIARWRSGA